MAGIVVGFSANPEEHVVFEGSLPEGVTARVNHDFYDVRGGGSSFNIHKAVAGAGIASMLFVPVGYSPDGKLDFNREQMDHILSGMSAIRLPLRDRHSSRATILCPVDGPGGRILAHKPPILQDRVPEAVEKICGHLRNQEPEFLVMTGIMEDELPLARTFIEHGKDGEGRMVFAPHASLVKSGKARELLPMANYLFLSAIESQELLGKGMTLQELQGFCREHGLELVSVSNGKRGLWIATPEDAFRIPELPFDGTIIDPTGAGDAVISGMLISFLKGHNSVRTAALQGAAHARLVCTKIGGSSVPSWDKVEQLADAVRSVVKFDTNGSFSTSP
ncbi:carbohydrate kinase family protein [Patescibacteria group bacterium]|nr:carbohydrate kinase family protein [Patescibacteria group bacterium]MBU1075214.1 carbohydrate kinase family protein [Patescibacteria group bacterium]MBU1951990.1 carbohydrate kinase family protein [Patescibacteria group bacterium]MBU2229362.1 carbohydrate kinase family protein [Patescibacteria group bacterium]